MLILFVRLDKILKTGILLLTEYFIATFTEVKDLNTDIIWQMYCEEDWYIGACTRADAEHALHLVNKVLYLL